MHSDHVAHVGVLPYKVKSGQEWPQSIKFAIKKPTRATTPGPVSCHATNRDEKKSSRIDRECVVCVVCNSAICGLPSVLKDELKLCFAVDSGFVVDSSASCDLSFSFKR